MNTQHNASPPPGTVRAVTRALRTGLRAGAILAALLLPWQTGLAHEAHQHEATPSVKSGVRVRLADAVLITQEGKPFRFTDEAVAGRILVVDFVYTSCTTYCPVASALMNKVREQLGANVGRDVLLLSVSVDPRRDTPARLAAYAQKFGPAPGWIWLTGAQPAVTAVLKGMGTYTANFEDHPAVLLVGDPANGRWSRLNGLPDPSMVQKQVESLLAGRNKGHQHTGASR